ncbi:hypothetical protein SAMN04487904_11912 [Actinopolyspora lacussalsi subsp. righensis]|uniref:Uncharacterized protein n=1 Tax=Actinopolyspora righensis TaxID=995060 RepID=A0A1I7CFG1_9ACTN|nr:hypothetical protein [Actinopolyspora righensis]SFT98180.1 hypothetical protein SAMN04487904_11912 [Actinopolyspora righensis]
MTDQARQALENVRHAPSLYRRPRVAEITLAVISLGALSAGASWVIQSDPPLVWSLLAALAILAVPFSWHWAALRAPGRAPWRRIDTLLAGAALLAGTFPVSELLWSDGSSGTSAWVASAVATVMLAVFIGVRWRR